MEKRKRIIMTTQIEIENLKCGGCANTIKKGLLSLDAVTEVAVDVETSMVSITSESENLQTVKEKLAKMGYPEVGDRNTLAHKAKSFVSCAVGRMDSDA